MDAGPSDAAPGDGAVTATLDVPFSLPRIAPCPEGWTEVLIHGYSDLRACEPWARQPTCDRYQARFPGDADCVPIGTNCPAGEWPDDLPSGRHVLYVDDDAPAGGSGTIDAPFTEIYVALDNAAKGSVIAVAKGRFDTPAGFEVDVAGVSIIGACPRETLIGTTAAGVNTEAIRISAVGVSVSNLRVVGTRGGIRVDLGASVEVAGVVIDNVGGSGIEVVGGLLAANGVAIRESDFEGIRAFAGSDVQLSRVELFQTGGLSAVTAVGSTVAPARVAIAESIIRSPRGLLIDPVGIGVGRAELTLQRVVIEGVRASAIEVAGGIVEIEDTLIRGGEVGLSVIVTSTDSAAHVELDRTFLEQCDVAGLRAFGDGATIDVTDSIIADTRGADGFGRGAIVEFGAHLSALRSVLIGNREVGLETRSGIAEIREVAILGTLAEDCSSPPCAEAHGVVAIDAARLSANLFTIADNDRVGLLIATAAMVELRHGEIARHAIGMNLQLGGSDSAPVLDAVVFTDNAADTSTAALPIPERPPLQ
jgi:hypothetical protein